VSCAEEGGNEDRRGLGRRGKERKTRISPMRAPK